MKNRLFGAVIGVGLGLAALFATPQANATAIGIFGDYSSSRSNLAADLSGLGYTVTNVSTLAGLGALSQYSTIWFVNAFTPLTGAEQTTLAGFLAGGGGLYLTGERPCCEPNNASVGALINSVVVAGGITVGGLGDIGGPYNFNPSAIDNATTSPNALTTWNPNAPGGMAGVTGSNVLVTGTGGTPVGGIWDESDLVGGVGRIALLMDVNWLERTNRLPVVANLETFLEAGAPVSVPEPDTLALVGFGLGALGLLAWRRKRKQLAA